MIVAADLAQIPLAGTSAAAVLSISRAGRGTLAVPSTTGEEILEGDHDDEC